MEVMLVVQVVSFAVCVFVGTVCVLGHDSYDDGADLNSNLK